MKYGLRPRFVERHVQYMNSIINKYVNDANTKIEYDGSNVIVKVGSVKETVIVDNYSVLTFLSWAIVSKIDKMHKSNGNETIGNKITDLFIG